ncbi:MAG: 4-hydroxy-tetrahydrodipicolinate reductase [Caulobacteraceae bacterium]
MRAPTRIAIVGAAGRMGQALIAAASGRRQLAVSGAFNRAEANCGAPAEALLAQTDVVIDFSIAASSADLAMRLARRGGPAMVIGVTGFSPQQQAAIRDAAGRIAIVQSANFSIGLNLLAAFAQRAAARLAAADWDVEIIEAHHRRKRDAPSGSALMLGEAAARGRGASLESLRAPSREGVTAGRREGEIGFAIVRGGGLVGEHSVLFAAEDEILTFSHSARERGAFARGALRAATWVRNRTPGLYGMADVLAGEA